MVIKNYLLPVALGGLLLGSLQSLAGLPSAQSSSALFPGVTFQGRLLSADGTTAMTGVVDFVVGIYSQNGKCLLYEERQNGIDLSVNSGFYSIHIGSAVGDGKRTVNDPGKSLAEIFKNGTQIVDASFCTDGAPGYTPLPGEARRVRMTMIPQGGASETFDDIALSPVPQAVVAETVQGLLPEDLIQAAGTVTQSALGTITAGASSDASTLHNHDSLYAKVQANGTLALAQYSGVPATRSKGDTWYDSSDNTVKYWNGTAAVAVGSGMSSITSSDIETALGFTPANSSTVTTALSGKEPTLAAATSDKYYRGDKTWQVLNTDAVPEGATNKYYTGAAAKAAISGTLPVDYSLITGTITLKGLSGLGTSNQLVGMKADGSQLEYKTVSGTANQVNVTHAAGGITLSTPQNLDASATPTFAGMSLTGALTLPGAPTQDLQACTKKYVDDAVLGIDLSGKLSTAGGSLTGTLNLAAGTTTVAPLKFSAGANLSTATAGAMEFDGSNLYITDGTNARKMIAAPVNPGTGDYLKWDGAKWITAGVAGATGGTVTSVATGTGLSGGPISGSGTISLADTAVAPGSYTRANITVDQQGRLTAASSSGAVNLANTDVTGTLPISKGGTGATSFGALQVLATDAAGDLAPIAGVTGQFLAGATAGAPSFRSLTASDIPNLDAAKITTGTLSSSLIGAGAIADSQLATGISGSKISGDISGNAANVTGVVGVTHGGTGLASFTAGDMVYASGANTLAGLAKGTDGKVLTMVSGAPAWQAPATSGTVTSVGLSLPSEFTITGSTVTSSGSLSAVWNTAAQNTVFAGPTTGGGGTPAFRALGSDDLPNLDWAKITSGKPNTLSGYGITDAAPKASKYIVQGTADAGLSGAQFLGALGTGLLKNTTTTGVLSVATPGTDYLAGGNNTVANSNLAQMPANTMKGNNTGGVANASDLTAAQVTAMLDSFAGSTKGLVPASGGGTTNFLRADGSWVAPPATDLTTATNFGTAAAGAVTVGKAGVNTILNGNVGIGTTAPVDALSVYETANSVKSISLGVSGTGANQAISFDLATKSNSTASLGQDATTKGWSISAYSDNYSAAAYRNDFNIGYWNGAAYSAPFVIDSDTGNIGISNWSPGYKLDVTGDAKISSGLITPKIYPAADSTTAFQINKANGTTNVLNVDTTNGNVGIGTTNPTSPLWVQKDQSAFTDVTVKNASTANGMVGAEFTAISSLGTVYFGIDSSGVSGGSAWVWNASNTPLKFATNNTEKMMITSAGNVGIGATNPGAKLEVNGQVKITGGVPGSGKVLTSDAAGLATWETPAAGMTYPGAGIAVSSGAAWGTSLSATELTGLAGLSSNGLVKRTGAGAYTTDSTSYAPLASPTFTGTVTTPAINLSGLTESTVPYIDASKNLVSSAVTPSQLGYLDATSSIQTQLNGKLGSALGVGNIWVGNGGGAAAQIAVSGDGTLDTTGTLTVSKINGTSVPTNAAADQTLVTTAAATASWASIPNCADSSGNHLNYDASTHSFVCGTTSASPSQWTTSGSNIYYTTGNIGLGTASPGSRLDVLSSGAVTSASTASTVTNTSTSSTASINKIGLNVSSTGTWNGASSNNYGIKIEPTSGGSSNYNIWSGPTNLTDLGTWLVAANGGVSNVFARSTNGVANTYSQASLMGWAAAKGALASNEGIISLVGEASAEQTSGTLFNLIGVQGELDINTSGGVNNAAAFMTSGSKAGTGTVTTLAGLWNYTFSKSGGTVTTLYGARLDNQSIGATNYNLYINQTSTGANNYSLYSAGAAKSYFAGNVGIGTSSPTQRLTVPWLSGDTAATAYIGSTNASNNQIGLQSESYSSHGVKATSNSGYGVYAISESGYALVASSTSGTGVYAISSGASAALHASSSSGNSGFFSSGSAANTSATLAVRAVNTSTADLFQIQAPDAQVLLKVNSAGSLGIGTSNPGYKLDVQGGDINASGSVRSAGSALTSDLRLKEDLVPLEGSLDKLLTLQGYHYYWKDKKLRSDQLQIGLIAQDVQKVFPETVSEGKDGFLGVDYAHLVAPVVEAIKTLYQRLTTVENHQSTQDREIASVKVENAELKQRAEKAEHDAAAIKAYLCAKDPAAPFCR